MNTQLSRPERRRALAAFRKKAKRTENQPKPDPAGNRATRRAAFRLVHKQPKVRSREDTVKKKKYRRWLRGRGLPVTRWNYVGCVLPSA